MQLMRVRWNGGHNPQLFREAASRLVELAQQQGTLRMLLELNDQPDVPVFDQLWLTTTLLPRALQLPVRQLVIILSNKRVYNRHVLESLLTQFQAHIQADIQFFSFPESALDWLTEHSPRVAELQAEWALSTDENPDGFGQPTVRYGRS